MASSLSSSWRALISRGKLSVGFPFLRTAQGSQDPAKCLQILQHDEGQQEREGENLQHLRSSAPLPAPSMSSSSSSPSFSPILQLGDSIISGNAFAEHKFGPKEGLGSPSLGLEFSLHNLLSKNQVGIFKLGFPKHEGLTSLEHGSERFWLKKANSFGEAPLAFEAFRQRFLNSFHSEDTKLERYPEERLFIRMPSVLGSESISMEADSVKRKRKKKMNKHKHRKLRRLARKGKK